MLTVGGTVARLVIAHSGAIKSCRHGRWQLWTINSLLSTIERLIRRCVGSQRGPIRCPEAVRMPLAQPQAHQRQAELAHLRLIL